MNFFRYKHQLELEFGSVLSNVTVAYQVWGELNKQRNNVVWVLHAITGSSDVVQWWPEVVGNGKLFDPNKHFIICANMIGSCYGSTFDTPQPSGRDSSTDYAASDVLITTRDVVKVFSLLADELGIDTIHAVIGGSMGGQQALEWAVQQPERIRATISIAANAKHSAWGIAFNAAQRMAIEADATFDSQQTNGGAAGLAAARAIGMLSYRTPLDYHHKRNDDAEKLEGFAAESYQRYQGMKLVKRFNARSYHRLTRTMDSHDVGRGRGGLVRALNSIRSQTIVVGIDSDILFPTFEQKFIVQHVPGAQYVELSSIVGHDAFLADQRALAELLRTVLNQ